ncbi:unnamed protein product [Amoebophrya sp. A25]|nr:unnamed protein product [Amoebophrya sp. A25]|eukprot:GSA25T00017517001.1
MEALQDPWIKERDPGSGAAPARLLNGDVLGAIASFHKRSASEKATAIIMTQCVGGDEVQAPEKVFMSLDVSNDGAVELLKNELKRALVDIGRTDRDRVRGFDYLLFKTQDNYEEQGEKKAKAKQESAEADKPANGAEKKRFSKLDSSMTGSRQSATSDPIDEVRLTQMFDDLDYNKDQHIYFSDFFTAVMACKAPTN